MSPWGDVVPWHVDPAEPIIDATSPRVSSVNRQHRKGCVMKKAVVGGLIGGAVVAAVLVAKKAQSSGSGDEREASRAEKRREMFAKMQAGMEAMPDDFPPVVLFNNVAAIRETTERIVELLEEDRTDADGSASATS